MLLSVGVITSGENYIGYHLSHQCGFVYSFKYSFKVINVSKNNIPASTSPHGLEIGCEGLMESLKI